MILLFNGFISFGKPMLRLLIEIGIFCTLSADWFVSSFFLGFYFISTDLVATDMNFAILLLCI